MRLKIFERFKIKRIRKNKEKKTKNDTQIGLEDSKLNIIVKFITCSFLWMRCLCDSIKWIPKEN